MGDAKSLVIHPASTTHHRMNKQSLKNAGITEDTVRLSVGIEDINDLKEDLDEAMGRVKNKPLAPIPALKKANIKHTHNQSSFKKNKTMVGVSDKDYDKAKKIVGNVEDLISNTEEYLSRKRGRLKIGVAPAGFQRFLSEPIQRMVKAYAVIRPEIISGYS